VGSENWFTRQWAVLKESFKHFGKADPLVLASSIAFFTIFALPGVLVILVEVSATMFQDDKVKDALLHQAGGLMGQGLAEYLYEVVQDAGVEDTGIWDRMFGIVAVIISATMAFMALQRGLNKIWGVKFEDGKGFKQHLVTRGIALLLLAGFSFLLPFALMFDNFVLFAYNNFIDGDPSASAIAAVGRITSILLMIVVLMLLYKVLPNAKVRWGDVWQGAMIAGLLFALGRFVIVLYIKATGIGEAFGTGQIVLVVLLWMFMSAMIILFGAFHCYTVAVARGHAIEPGRQAREVNGHEDIHAQPGSRT
jgi:membrane protein